MCEEKFAVKIDGVIGSDVAGFLGWSDETVVSRGE